MVDTRDRAKAGTTEYEALVCFVVPLADPEAVGNLGMDGFDENTTTRRFRTVGLAERWLRTQVRLPDARCAEVRQVHWIADEFEDDEYGVVRDAYQLDGAVRYYRVDDGQLVFEDEVG